MSRHTHEPPYGAPYRYLRHEAPRPLSRGIPRTCHFTNYSDLLTVVHIDFWKDEPWPAASGGPGTILVLGILEIFGHVGIEHVVRSLRLCSLACGWKEVQRYGENQVNHQQQYAVKPR